MWLLRELKLALPLKFDINPNLRKFIFLVSVLDHMSSPSPLLPLLPRSHSGQRAISVALHAQSLFIISLELKENSKVKSSDDLEFLCVP